ncbi:hypothetical protein [Methylobrevis pamukkalensis]|uniref:Glycosyl transferase family 2 n=1 Tax=Methylobrevis pamukkalensis TaxID=1439726 RepID=A0A1E3GZV3_9HYPH|nr:hypothetical protein [Methylobrevis pamukkalensis]ODN69455.1 hypothetical protein A6302_03222 [Methylobrevis pamukkalensis]
MSVLPRDVPFNWSFLNNEALGAAAGEIVVFANDDMEMLSTGWDDRLRGLLARPEVGAVGARLLYPDRTVQHAGVLMGWKGSVIHDGLHEAEDAEGPGRRWAVTRATAAVTGAFLAARKADVVAAGGLDDRFLPVAYSDIDLALKLRARGLRILVTPRIELIHHESKSRGLDHTDPARAARNRAEAEVMAARWGAAMIADPGRPPAYVQDTMPFRLIVAPSQAIVLDHIRLTAAPNLWATAAIDPALPHPPV